MKGMISMAFCIWCGAPLEEDVKFCTNCGAAVEEAAPEVAAAAAPEIPPAAAPEVAPAPAFVQENTPPFDQQPQPAPGYQQPGPSASPQQPFTPVGETQAAPVDAGSIGWAILGFLIPLVGFILFFVWRNTKPQSAKMSLIGACVGLCLGILFQFMG
jgi:hypothetical protein